MSWADGTTASRSAEALEQAVRTSLGVVLLADYASGSGSDEATAVQAAITAAGSSRILMGDPGKSYTVGTALTLPSGLRWWGNGSTIKKTTTLNDYALKATGDSVEIRDLTVDGNRLGGNSLAFGCVLWSGAGGIARRVKANSSARHGFVVTGAGCVLDAYDCEALSHVWAGNGNGFQVSTGAILRAYRCRADFNDADGFVFNSTAAAGCHLDGTANTNLGAGAKILCAGGTGGSFVTRNNKTYGIYAFGSAACSNWKFDYVADFECGRASGGEYTPNAAATSVELFGVSKFVIHTLVSYHPMGYGIALTRDTGTNVGCTECSVLAADIWGAGDPGVHISGSSKKNTIIATVRQCTVAFSTGEAVPGAANDDNDITIVTQGCTFAAINLDSGSRNRIRLRSTDTIQNSPYTALIRVRGAATGACANNRIWLESTNPNSTAPNYAMTCDASASGNFVYCYDTPASTVGVLSDANGSNRVYLLTKTAL